MAYRLPKTANDAYMLADSAVGLWAERDTRMREHQEAWELKKRRLKKHQRRVAANDNATAIDKGGQLLAAAPIQVEVVPATDDDTEPSQRVEDAARWVVDQLELRQVMALRQSLKAETAVTGLLRGWLPAICTFNPATPEFPFRLQTPDPMDIYPDSTAMRPSCYVHRYRATRRELEHYWGKEQVGKALEADDRTRPQVLDDGTIACYAFYTDEEMGVLLESRGWISKPREHGYGFNPAFVSLGPGAPYRRTELGDDSEFTKYIGGGLLRTSLEAAYEKQEILQIARRNFELTAAPPFVYNAQNPDEAQKNPYWKLFGEPAQNLVIALGESITQYPPPPMSLQHETALLTAYQDMLNRSGFGPAVYGDSRAASGFMQTLQVGSTLDTLHPYVDMLKWWWMIVLRAFMRLFGLFGADDLQYWAQDRVTGQRTALNRLSPFDAWGADARLLVQLGEINLRDQMARAQQATMLTDRGLISHEYALREYLRVENPTAEMRKALRDQFYKDPQMLRIAMLFEKAQDPTDEIGATVAMMLFDVEIKKFSLALTTQSQPGLGQGSPPIPGVGLPSQVAPDELMQNAGMGPNGVAMGPPQVGAGLQLGPLQGAPPPMPPELAMLLGA